MINDFILGLLQSDDYKERVRGEYYFVKEKYEKLHKMIIKREAGKLDFSPARPMEKWKAQAAAMESYLYQLEVGAYMEDIEL